MFVVLSDDGTFFCRARDRQHAIDGGFTRKPGSLPEMARVLPEEKYTLCVRRAKEEMKKRFPAQASGWGARWLGTGKDYQPTLQERKCWDERVVLIKQLALAESVPLTEIE